MKAAVIHQFGDVDVLRYEDVETPKPKAGHILIKVLAAGINRFDHYIREGSVVSELPFPHILCADTAGEVAAPDEGVARFEIGERSYPLPAIQWTRKMRISTPELRYRATACVGGTFMVVTLAAIQEARRVAPTNSASLIATMTAAFAIGQILGPP